MRKRKNLRTMTLTERKSKVFIYNTQFSGLPATTDFKLVEETLPPLKIGEFLAEAVYLSVDPYMRSYVSHLKVGETFIGTQVAKIIGSKNEAYPVGEYVVGQYGWRTLTISGEKTTQMNFPTPWIVPDIGDLPKSLTLGVLGMPGNTAYFGFLNICKPKVGETVVVTGAGGAVGSHVGQIAKMKGCKVIGVAGSDEKGKWLVDELGFDHFINYKTSYLATALLECAPNGIDCYFDNVGGEISSIILNKMNKFGRVAVCGSISTYNSGPDDLPKASEVQTPVKINHLRMEAMSVLRYKDCWFEGIKQNLAWIKEGKLKYRETITDGFENITEAFVGMLQGTNIGKAIVKV